MERNGAGCENPVPGKEYTYTPPLTWLLAVGIARLRGYIGA